MKVIGYHGTSEEVARIIRKEGFRDGTFFARHLEDAIGFGGPWVFEVVFDRDDLPNHWQFTTGPIVPERIVRITEYQAKQHHIDHGQLDALFA